MNTEDRLRRASQEMDRVTASVTAPPIEELRRSSRMRAVGAVLAGAIATLVVVGGAVLLFDRTGATTLEPAGPAETTTTLPAVPAEIDGIPVRIPELDEAPEWPVSDDAAETSFQLPAQVESDLRLVVNRLGMEGPTEEILVLGESGGLRSYLLRGQYTRADEATGVYTACVVVMNADRLACFADHGLEHVIDLDDAQAGGTFGIVGTSVPGASVAVLEIDGVKSWIRTREGTANIVGHASIGSSVDYVVYDALGNPLELGVVWSEDRAATFIDPQTNTTALAVADDGSCSGDLYYPSTDHDQDLPAPVVQTLNQVMLLGSRCSFDELEALGGENFNASFGGDDPSTLWTMQEEDGEQPMYALMKILDMPYGTVDLGGQLMYVWPSAAAFDDPWGELPESDRQALLSLYTDEDLQSFADFGGYLGYRIGITAGGDWSFFVAGD